VEHRTDVEQLQIRPHAAAEALQRAEEEHSTGMVKQQIVLRLADQGGDITHECGVRDGDVGDCGG
jgi:hypothetical protein